MGQESCVESFERENSGFKRIFGKMSCGNASAERVHPKVATSSIVGDIILEASYCHMGGTTVPKKQTNEPHQQQY